MSIGREMTGGHARIGRIAMLTGQTKGLPSPS
jgi:hypothetical protein